MWRGRPHPMSSARAEGGTLLFAVLWLTITGFSVGAALRSGEAMAGLIPAAFGAAGLYILAQPIVAYMAARHTSYTITDQRLIISKKRHQSLTSIQLSGVTQVERLHKHGRTTLRIPASLVSDGDGGKKVDFIELHGIEDAQRAYRLLTQRSA